MARTNRVLTFCWREWRAQRNVLLAYTGMGIAALCLVFLLMPEHWWKEGSGAHVLSWFLALGALGVAMFAAPALVRSEYGTKHDHFVRRLPGALLPSFGGKLLFIGLLTIALPMLCALFGQAFLLALDRSWEDPFFVERDGAVSFSPPWPLQIAVVALLLAPWVWAIGTWLPGGRMAIGGTVLFVLLLGIGVFAVLRQSPKIEHGIAWQQWLWLVPPLGVAAAAVSWTKGRRGGGPLRSLRFGAAVTAAGLMPPSAWLANRAWDYHHPDLQHLGWFDSWGRSPDGRYVLASGNTHGQFAGVPFRIDLDTGAAVQLAGVGTHFTAEVLHPSRLGLHGCQQYWRWFEYSSREERMARHCVLDLTTLDSIDVAFDSKTYDTNLPSDLRARVLAESREQTQLRAPGGVRVWFDASELCFEDANGSVERVLWDSALPRTVRPVGHGIEMFGDRRGVYDLTARRFVLAAEKYQSVWCVRGTVLYQKRHAPATWLRVDASSGAPVPATLPQCHVLGLFDDDHLLCRRGLRDLFLWHVADGREVPLALPDGTPDIARVFALAPLYVTGSLLARDPRGRVWLWDSRSTLMLCIDAASRTVTRPAQLFTKWTDGFRLLAWPDARTVLAQIGQIGARIERIDVDTGERTVLFPRR